ncbi:hypothetical protein SLEP1_g39282 [Rubroshorea leprosula]|uniref:Uncharacterized protein n=1 Tax=Rubroshorea leprosula TaxID=152421 RepID=A0AAV5KZP9_9ROSI|nr:hypothetical protein SLEP1_g39282 [Rubroshorea leprosula]
MALCGLSGDLPLLSADLWRCLLGSPDLAPIATLLLIFRGMVFGCQGSRLGILESGCNL